MKYIIGICALIAIIILIDPIEKFKDRVTGKEKKEIKNDFKKYLWIYIEDENEINTNRMLPHNKGTLNLRNKFLDQQVINPELIVIDEIKCLYHQLENTNMKKETIFIKNYLSYATSLYALLLTKDKHSIEAKKIYNNISIKRKKLNRQIKYMKNKYKNINKTMMISSKNEIEDIAA